MMHRLRAGFEGIGKPSKKFSADIFLFVLNDENGGEA